MNRPCVFFDADVLFAGAASPAEYSASQVVLALGQMGLLASATSEQAVAESERNIGRKLPDRLIELRLIVRRALTVVPNPSPAELDVYQGLADPKDLPILVAALKHGCRRLLTFNIRHFWPPKAMITVQRPGEFLLEVRAALATLDAAAPGTES